MQQMVNYYWSSTRTTIIYQPHKKESLQVNDDNVVQDAILMIKILIFAYSAIFRVKVVQSGWPSKRSPVNSDYTTSV
jgi:hypothetical protein